VLALCHDLACDGHFGSRKTVENVLQSGFYWPTLFKDSFNFCKLCKNCQMTGRISSRDMMPLNLILDVEIFNIWDIDFMWPFPISFGNQYILVAVDYVSEWVKAVLTRTKDNKVIVKFLKENIISCLGAPV